MALLVALVMCTGLMAHAWTCLAFVEANRVLHETPLDFDAPGWRDRGLRLWSVLTTFAVSLLMSPALKAMGIQPRWLLGTLPTALGLSFGLFLLTGVAFLSLRLTRTGRLGTALKKFFGFAVGWFLITSVTFVIIGWGADR